MDKKVYVIIPNADVYYGITVDKDTKTEFENEFVKQKIENLKLYSVVTKETDEFKSVTNLEVNLKEGDILLLEEDGRGYFLPANAKLGSIDDAINEYQFLKEQISKIKE